MKRVRVVLSPDAEKAYFYINEHAAHSKREQAFLRAVNRKIELIKANPHYGDPVSKRLIPEQYRKEFGITNLFRVELPGYWRRLYTLTGGGSQVEIIAFVLDMLNHKDYDKKFGYK